MTIVSRKRAAYPVSANCPSHPAVCPLAHTPNRVAIRSRVVADALDVFRAAGALARGPKRPTTYSENYKKLLAIVEEMTMINMTLLKENAGRISAH